MNNSKNYTNEIFSILENLGERNILLSRGGKNAIFKNLWNLFLGLTQKTYTNISKLF